MRKFTKIWMLASLSLLMALSSTLAIGQSANGNMAENEKIAYDEPTFAMTPDTYSFGEVGLLNGTVHYSVDNAEFSITNAGIGSFNVSESPYFFSGNNDEFAIAANTNEYPYTINGPSFETNEACNFAVEFNPTTAGSKNTLLVVKDDLDRVVRTFSITGSAYDIPDGDIVENAFTITNDWNTTFDYAVEGDFTSFYTDYNLSSDHDKDVVYTTSVDKDSYLTLTAVNGVTDVAVFAQGAEIIEANNLYTGDNTELTVGTYVIVVSGTEAYDFNLHIEGQEPVLAVTPESMDLGDVPIGAWHQGGTFEVSNIGGQTYHVENVSLSDENNVYSLEYHYNMPLEIAADTYEFNIFLDAETAGTYDAAFLLTDNETTRIYNITANAYVPVEGDVAETAYEVEFVNGVYTQTASVATPMHNNYVLDNDAVNDVVYDFSVANDVVLNIALSDIAADFNGSMKLYNKADLRSVNPQNLVPVATGSEIADFELWAGDYMLVLSGNAVNADYTLTINVVDMPKPGAITLVSPADADDNVNVNTTLTWELGEYTNNVDLYLGTTYPPTTKVLDGVSFVESYETETLSPSQIYFWQVVAHNSNDSTVSEIHAFTTILPAPLYVQGEIVDFTNVHLWWNNPYQADITWTEDFEGAELPEGWTASTVATGSSAGWMFGDNLGSQYFDIPSHTNYAAVNDDANNGDASMDYLVTPAQNLTNGDAATLTFQSCFNAAYGEEATVEVSTDNGATWTVVSTLEAAEGWSEVTIDLTEYQVDNTLIGFHYNDNGGWAAGWAIDDVTVNLENSLPWETRDFLGYNVYQDGVKINTEIVSVEEYDVLDLAAGTYVFGVSAVYNEGESQIVTIDEITILGEGTLSGTVIDADTNDGIENATITIASNDLAIAANYTATTDVNGNYSIVVPVLTDGYNVTAAFGGYGDVVEPQVDVIAADVVTLNFVLGEFPIPVTDVVAVVNDNDTEVDLTWGEPTSFPAYEITYDDGDANNATCWNAGYEGNMNAIRFTPAGYPATVTTAKIHIWDGTWPAGNVLSPMEVVVLDDDGANGLPGTELGSITITPDAANWVTVDLSTLNINIADGDFYIANRQISVSPDCPPTAIAEGTPANRSYAYSDGSWAVASYDCFMIRAEVSGPRGTESLNYDGTVVVNGTSNEGAVAINNTTRAAGTYTAAAGTFNEIETANTASRAVNHYEVYRFAAADVANPAAWALIADDVTATEYNDASWTDLEMGVYQYAVKAVYTVTTSEASLSNTVGRDMICNAVVLVDLNTGDSPEGAVVTFTNVEDPTIVFTATVPASGTVNFSDFWKGTYTLTVAKDLYDTYLEENIIIIDDAFVRNVTLEETLASPVNFVYETDCKDVHLTWEQGIGGGTTTGDEFTEDFEAGIPADWTFVDADGDSYNWDYSDGFNAHSGVGCMYSASYINNVGALTPNNYMITPEMNIGSSSVLRFWYVGQDPSYAAEHFYVKVSTTDNNPSSFTEVVADLTATGDYQEGVVDLSDFAGETVFIAFQHCEVSDMFYLNLDDISMSNATRVNATQGYIAGTSNVEAIPFRTSGMAQSEIDARLAQYNTNTDSREFIGYNVYRDGALLTASPITETEYWDENVVGGSYAYEVAAVYSTGISPLAGPLDVAIELLNSAQNLTAEKQSWNNVELNWDAPSDLPIYTLEWDNGVNEGNAIGTNDVFDFDVASRWAVEDIASYDGMTLTKVSFFPNEEACEYSIRVWTGEDATLIVDQVVADVTIGEWNTVVLDTPVTIDASEELWFGYRANATTGYPAGCDAGPAVAGKGDMIYDAESGWLSMSESYGLDYNWNIAATVEAVDGAESNLTEIIDTDRNTNNGIIKVVSAPVNNVERAVLDRELVGYNVLRDGEQINNQLINATYYIDFDVPVTAGVGVDFNYEVVAVYASGCIADASNTVTVSFGTDVDPLAADDVNIYPNPATVNVTVKVTDNVNSFRIMNLVGQVVAERNVMGANKVQVNTVNFEAGTYLIQFTTNNGSVINKRFVIAK